MAKAFGEESGQAKKSELEYIKFEFGENKMRMVGGILPRYAYWKQLRDNSIPVECLSFDRDKERFTNIEKDWFKHYFPTKANGENMTCSWSYIIQVIDLKDGKLKLCGLKKKLYDAIKDLSKELGNPTDSENGWDVIFEKKKTGSNRFNVEYKLKERAIKNRPLTEDEKAIVAKLKVIDEVVHRPTSEEQRAFIESAWVDGAEEESNVDQDAAGQFDDKPKAKSEDDGFDDDITF